MKECVSFLISLLFSINHYLTYFLLTGQSFQSQRSLVSLPDSDHQKPILECHKNCKCSHDKCLNQVLSHGPLPCLTTFQTDNKGTGLTTAEPISRLTFVCEYLGEFITKEEAIHRLKKTTPSYLLTVNELYSTSNRQTFIDARHHGNIARFINHSCEPNLVSLVVHSGTDVPRVGLFAQKNIAVGDELTFSYASGSSSLSTTSCLCGASACNGYLPFDNVT